MANLLYFFTICTLPTVWCACDTKFKVTLYQNKDYKGMFSLLEDNKCRNVDAKLDNQVSSIKIETGCVQTSADADCKEYLETFSVNVDVGYPSAPNLRGTDVQDAVTSVGPCRCGGKYKVQLHSDKMNTGQMQVIESDKCENLNDKLNDKVSSVIAETGCVSIHREPNCKVFMDKYSSDGKNGFVSNSNLGLYRSQNDAISSVGPCY